MVGELYSITPFTMLDFPGEAACIAWFSGCNLRCLYCHNPDIVHGTGHLTREDFENFLKSRKGLLTGVVLSGGEATLAPDLAAYAQMARRHGFKIKLDTNGTRPSSIAALVDEGLVDSVALDFKCWKDQVESLLGRKHYWEPLQQSLAFLIAAQKERRVILEVRTTFHADLMPKSALDNIVALLDEMGFQGTYAVQNIASHGEMTLGGIGPPSRGIRAEELPQAYNFNVTVRAGK